MKNLKFVPTRNVPLNSNSIIEDSNDRVEIIDEGILVRGMPDTTIL